MAFQFKPATGVEDAAEVAYEVPPIPAGVSYALRQAIDGYTKVVLGDAPGSDDDAFAAIQRFQPNGIPDVIAKLIYGTHFDARGAYGEQLLIVSTSDVTSQIAAAECALADLYRLMPDDWTSARANYEAALAAERDFDARVYKPAAAVEDAGGPPVPPEIEGQDERLNTALHSAERILLETPAPDLAAFAFKYLICYADDRGYDGYTAELCADAKRLLAETPDG